jgi:hypothetical protein
VTASPIAYRSSAKSRPGRGAALILTDLKRHHLLDGTLVVWAGEFGRTPIDRRAEDQSSSVAIIIRMRSSIWMAGGGIKGGITLGQTGELSFYARSMDQDNATDAALPGHGP